MLPFELSDYRSASSGTCCSATTSVTVLYGDITPQACLVGSCQDSMLLPAPPGGKSKQPHAKAPEVITSLLFPGEWPHHWSPT